jgi:hypothetical protein
VPQQPHIVFFGFGQAESPWPGDPRIPLESRLLDGTRGTGIHPTIASAFPSFYHARFFIQSKVPFTLISWYFEGVQGYNFTHSLTR